MGLMQQQMAWHHSSQRVQLGGATEASHPAQHAPDVSVQANMTAMININALIVMVRESSQHQHRAAAFQHMQAQLLTAVTIGCFS
jgi:hypothetical protein